VVVGVRGGGHGEARRRVVAGVRGGGRAEARLREVGRRHPSSEEGRGGGLR
jgi:hypothetical protein